LTTWISVPDETTEYISVWVPSLIVTAIGLSSLSVLEINTS
jgi:hypothetical protein